MKYLVALFFICNTLAAKAQTPEFNIRYSPNLSTYQFLKMVTSVNGNNPYKKSYLQSTYNNDANNALLKEFEALTVNYTYEYYDYPYGSKVPGMTESLLKKNLVMTNSITEFKERSIGIITNKDLVTLTRILTAFTPIYEQLIFLPNQTAFNHQLATLKNYTKQKNIAQYFTKGLQLYGSSWDSTINCEMIFYPLPPSEGFSAEAFYNISVSALPINYTDYATLLSVMLHELYHIQFDEQPLATKQLIENTFNKNKHTGSRYAALLLNEALATAAANGYVYEQLTGKPDSSDWYFFPYINQMAKKIYPIVKNYLANNKTIDNHFINEYCNIYQTFFAEWQWKTEHIFTYRYVLASQRTDFSVLNQLFPYCSMFEAEDAINMGSLQKMKEKPLTKIIIISKNHAAQLQLVKQYFPELFKNTLDHTKEFCKTALLSDKTRIVLVNKHQSSTEKLFKTMVEKTFGQSILTAN
ncbi:MAG: hypothetical protein ACOVQE_02595 [Chitinophagaceae bacterium]